MKKALSVFLMLALVGSVFAAEPVADVNIAEFKGDASVQWGVDIDSGRTGFKNSASVTLKLNLLNEGSKSTTGDGVWGELVIKTNGDTFAKATNSSNIALPAMNVVVDKAQINFGPAYVGITNGDTQTGKLKMDAAVKSADSDNAVTVPNVGPGDFTQGITIGYKNDMFNVAADVRSYNPLADVYTVEWSGDYKEDGKIVASGSRYFTTIAQANAFADRVNQYFTEEGELSNASSATVREIGTYGGIRNQYTNAYAMALEGEFTGVENLSVKAGVSYNFNDRYYDDESESYKDTGIDLTQLAEALFPTYDPEVNGKFIIAGNTLGYSHSIGYKLGLNNSFYLRPQVGFAGSTGFVSDKDQDISGSITALGMYTGLLFGWGDIGVDANPGVYYMDTDSYKKVSPGVGVVVSMPLISSANVTSMGTKYSVDFYSGTVKIDGKKDDMSSDLLHGKRTIVITPSFYSGEIIPGLTSAVYSNMGITIQEKADTVVAFDIAAAAKYAIPVAAGTITPQVGVKYANADANEGTESLTTKIGVDIAGFVANTTFFTVYDSGNFLAKDGAGKSEPSYGTLNFGAKISF